MDDNDLIARLTALEAAQKPLPKTKSFWIVHDPAFIKVWCPKSSCPNLGRKLEVETLKVKASDAQGLTESGEVETWKAAMKLSKPKL